MLRVIREPGSNAAHIENRIGDGTANPYLYLAVQVASGLAGLTRRARAACRPVVASAASGLANLVPDGTIGILVPPRNVPALRASIVRLLAEPGRRSRRERAARQHAAGYSASVPVPQIERVYQEVIGTPPPSVIARVRHVFR